MVYDREGRKLWIVEDTGRHTPVGSWDEISKRPRRADLPDWWLVAKDIAWRPPAGTPTGLPEGWTGNSLLSLHPQEVERLGAASGGGAGGTATKLGCGGRCQEGYDTATGRYVGNGGGTGGGGGSSREGGGAGGGQTRTRSEPAQTSTPARTGSAPPRSYKAAGADKTPPPPKWPESDPPTPPGVDLEKNMREAEAHRDDPDWDKLNWFKQQVNSGQPWDYKNIYDPSKQERIEDFGNFNYGATGAALGLTEDEIQRAPGAKQYLDHWNEPDKYTNLLVYPYGDDPRDAAMIRRGIAAYWRWKTIKELGGVTR